MVAKTRDNTGNGLFNDSFNPCSGGLWLLSGNAEYGLLFYREFQSLFWWIMVAKTK